MVDALVVRRGGAVTWTSMPLAALAAMRGDAGELSVGPVRFPLLDQSVALIHADTLHIQANLRGQGVAVAIVDTGIDVQHGDFRNSDGTTRIAWLLDLSRPATGAHADLEAQFGFLHDDGMRYGAVYDSADLDALLSAQSPELPTDEVGHGTYVASIAAGNGNATGAGQSAGRFVGVAPEATIIAVRASEVGTDAVTDAAVTAGVAFALDRAQALGQPVVVNLSIGSHFGTHDGGSPLERALAALVPPDTPGRAIVVAAGNDGLAPIHARVDLASNFAGAIPIMLAAGAPDDLAVVEIAYEGVASVAVQFPGGTTTAFEGLGESAGFATGEGLVSIANATDAVDDAPGAPSLTPAAPVHSAEVIFAGDPDAMVLRAAGTYTILVQGSGAVHAYVAEAGTATPPPSFQSPLASGTVDVPATAAGVISVGAAATPLFVEYLLGGGLAQADVDAPLGGPASFSARGPNRVNEPKPDLLAPGDWVIAAMSAEASPNQPLSIFQFGGAGTLVEEDGVHAAGRGSSAAAPCCRRSGFAVSSSPHRDAGRRSSGSCIDGGGGVERCAALEHERRLGRNPRRRSLGRARFHAGRWHA